MLNTLKYAQENTNYTSVIFRLIIKMFTENEHYHDIELLSLCSIVNLIAETYVVEYISTNINEEVQLAADLWPISPIRNCRTNLILVLIL